MNLNHLFIEGCKLTSLGYFIEAKINFKKILDINSKHFESINMLGAIEYLQNNFENAIIFYDKAIKIKPDYAEAWSNKGIALKNLRRYQEAISCYDKAIEIKPDYAQAHNNKGNVLQNLKRYNDAIVSFDKAIKIKSDYSDALSNMGISLKKLGRYEESLIQFQKAIQFNNKNHEIYLNISIILNNLERHDEALSYCDKAIKIKPDYAEAWSNKGIALKNLRRYQEAISCYDKAIEIKPDYAEVFSSKGVILDLLKLYEKSIIEFDTAIKINPNYAEAISNKGSTLSKQKKFNDAINEFDKAIKIDPGFSTAYFNKSLIKLLNGEFKEGWDLYEYRWKKINAEIFKYPKIKPILSLNEIKNKKILIWSEQGLGDTIQFSRYIKLLKKFETKVVFQIQTPLLEMFKNQLPCEITDKIKNENNFDFQSPLLSLPRLFATNLKNIPECDKIKINYNKSIELKEKFRLSSKKLNIGLAFSGNPLSTDDNIRSMPLKEIEPILGMAKFFILQNQIKKDDKEFLEKKNEIFFLGNQKILDILHIIYSLDLVITVDTLFAHLAGILNKKTFLMLNHYNDWRWFNNSTTSFWYPSIEIFRADSADNWKSIIQNISKRLINMS